MKKKIIVGIILIVLMFLECFSLYTVKASNKGLEPEGDTALQAEGESEVRAREQEETVTINKNSVDVKVEETIQLTASSSKNSTITWTSSNNSIATVNSSGVVKGIKEGTAVITAKGSDKSATCTVTVKAKDTSSDEPNDSDWTDFSKAKFELKKDGISKATVQVTNVVPRDDRFYYMIITSNSNKPSVTDKASDEIMKLAYNKDTKTFTIIDNSKVSSYVELNQDLYVSILEEKTVDEKEIVSYGKKLERYAESKYTDAFHATFMTKYTDQLVTTFTHSKENNRKIQIKVGKITDNSILQKIKSQDSSGFATLLSFAKSSNGIFNKTVNADKDDSFAIEYQAGEAYTTGQSVISLSGLENEAYYFLYIKADDENGKYTSPEAVTLARASVNKDDWWLFFYGSSDFKWADFENVNNTNNTDNTIAKGEIPQTGENIIVWVIVGLAIVGAGVFSYRQYKKNNF